MVHLRYCLAFYLVEVCLPLPFVRRREGSANHRYACKSRNNLYHALAELRYENMKLWKNQTINGCSLCMHRCDGLHASYCRLRMSLPAVPGLIVCRELPIALMSVQTISLCISLRKIAAKSAIYYQSILEVWILHMCTLCTLWRFTIFLLMNFQVLTKKNENYAPINRKKKCARQVGDKSFCNWID